MLRAHCSTPFILNNISQTHSVQPAAYSEVAFTSPYGLMPRRKIMEACQKFEQPISLTCCPPALDILNWGSVPLQMESRQHMSEAKGEENDR